MARPIQTFFPLPKQIRASVGVLVLAFASLVRGVEPGGESAPAISVVEVVQGDYALIEQTGAYWSVGSVLSQVMEDYGRLGATGPILVRYQQHPTRTPPSQLRFQVGFAVTGNMEVKHPYARIQLPAEKVAVIRVTDTIIRPSKQYAQLEQWSRTNGFEPTGPVTELYFPPFERSSKAPSTQSFIEVRMTIEQPKAITKPMTLPDTKAEEQFDPVPVVAGETADKKSEPPTAQVSEPVPQQEVKTPVANSSTPSPMQVKHPEPIYESVSISDLAKSGRYDEIASHMIPSNLPQVQGSEIWLAQFVPRLRAVVDGVEKNEPHSAATLKPLLDAVSARQLAIFPHAKDQFKNAANVQMMGKNQSVSEKHRRLVRDMDVLMVKVGYRSLDAAGVQGELLAILDRAFGTEGIKAEPAVP